MITVVGRWKERGDRRASRRNRAPAFLAFLFGAASALAQPPSRIPLAPCHLEGLAEEVLCGRLEVPEDRRAPQDRRITLSLAVLPALTSNPAPDPLFLLAGGPGQAATSYAVLAAGPFRKIRLKRDVVLLDQRGTGGSTRLGCGSAPDPLILLSDPLAPFRDPAGCLAGIDADARFYTNFQAVEDLDEVRTALGYERINLWGGSYGTRTALVYLSRFAEHARTVVLDGAAPFEGRFPLHTARDSQRSLDLLFAACAADAACSATFPDPAADLRAVLGRLEAGPSRVRLRDPRTGKKAEVEITRDSFAVGLRGALYVPAHRALIPHLLHEAARGNWEPFTAVFLEILGWSFETMAPGMMLSVLCSEDVPRIKPEEIDALSRGTFAGRGEIDGWIRVCRGWPRGSTPAGYEEPSLFGVPALILSGGQDPATPPIWGEMTAKQFTRSRHVVVAEAAHNVSFSGCVPDLIAAFIETGDPSTLDPSCVEAIRMPPFVTGTAGPRP